MIDVIVVPNAALPEGCTVRYKAESPVQAVTQVHYEPDDGPEGVWQVLGINDMGGEVPAHAVQVEDSGAGTSWLIWGGAFGLRLRLGAVEVAETHLLLALDQLVS